MTAKAKWSFQLNNKEPDWKQFDSLEWIKTLDDDGDNHYVLYGKFKPNLGGNLKALHGFETEKDCHYRAFKVVFKHKHLSYKLSN